MDIMVDMKRIKLGTWLKWIINIITLGTGKYISTWLAVDILGFESCGCCEREQWLNRLTDKNYNGHCGDVKLF
jgi:hypothetical protein